MTGWKGIVAAAVRSLRMNDGLECIRGCESGRRTDEPLPDTFVVVAVPGVGAGIKRQRDPQDAGGILQTGRQRHAATDNNGEQPQ